MINVFLDTNILLDFGQERSDYLYAKAIIELGEQGCVKLFASYLSYANMGYILRHYPRERMWALISDMKVGISVLPCHDGQLQAALGHVPVKDFEDLLQYQCAAEAGCDVIVSNNKRDFLEFATLPVLTSKEFLLWYFRTVEA